MIGRLLSFLALAALLVMPVGPAQAQAGSAGPMMAMSAGGHCAPGSAADADKSLPGSHCGTACTLLLPQPTRLLAGPDLARAARPAIRAAALDDCAVALATPPPKIG